MLVEELMILANEAVAGLLASRAARGALPRPRAARAAVDRALFAVLADLGVPTPPAPEQP